VTHPFHPLFGEELEFVKRRRNWRADRVYVLDPNRLLLSLPVEWTDVVGRTPSWWWLLGGRRSTLSGCSDLAELVAGMRAERSTDDPSGVNRTTP